MKRAIIGFFGIAEEVVDFGFFDIGTEKEYFPIKKVSQTKELADLIAVLEKNEKAKASVFISGPVIDSMNRSQVSKLKKLLKAGQLELFGGPNNQSVSCLLSASLFKEEVESHKAKLKVVFDYVPEGFVNSAVLFADDLAAQIEKLEFSYALAPRVPWFQFSGKEGAAFASDGGHLKLLLMDTSADNSIEVHVAQDFNTKLFAKHHSYFLASEFTSAKASTHRYRLPSIVACDLERRDFASLVGNSLQVQFYRKLKGLAAILAEKKDPSDEMLSTFLQLANVCHFRALREELASRHSYYLSLMNCLADFELQVED